MGRLALSHIELKYSTYIHRLKEYQDLSARMVQATGWKEEWIPARLCSIWNTMSAWAHGDKYVIEAIQGGKRDAIVVSLKVLPGM